MSISSEESFGIPSSYVRIYVPSIEPSSMEAPIVKYIQFIQPNALSTHRDVLHLNDIVLGITQFVSISNTLSINDLNTSFVGVGTRIDPPIGPVSKTIYSPSSITSGESFEIDNYAYNYVAPSVNSVLFDGVDDRLVSTLSTPTDNKVMTFSTWVKRSKISTDLAIFSVEPIANIEYESLIITSSNTIRLQLFKNGSWNTTWEGSLVIGDISDWHHILININTTLVGGSMVEMYINGAKDNNIVYDDNGLTAFATNESPSLNGNFEHRLGVYYTSNLLPFDGYMAITNFVDGQALQPSSFAEYSTNLQWSPKRYTGSYGINGFRLDYENVGNLGEDSSGNTNDFTVV